MRCLDARSPWEPLDFLLKVSENPATGVHVKKSISVNAGPEQELYLLLTDMFYLLDDTDRQFFGEFGLSTRQFWALHHLSETESLSMIDLSRLLFTDKSNVTAIADRLAAAGLVERRPDTQDRRVILLSLTPVGRQRHDQVLAVHNDRIRMLIGSDEEALHQAIRILEPIRKRLGQYLYSRSAQTTSSQSSPADEPVTR